MDNKITQNLFFVILTYKASLEKIDLFKSEHINFLDNYYKQNYFIASGPRVPRSGGVILAQTASKNELEKILSEDPFAVNDLADYQIIEFSPTKFNNVFEKLLKGEN